MTEHRKASESVSADRAGPGPVPPPMPLILDLDRWLDPGSSWRVPVPAPFDVTGAGILVGSGAGEREVQPAEEPWLPTEFAHVAAGLDFEEGVESPSFSVVREAVAFADRYGVTGPWSASRPPESVELAALLRQAWEIRQVLLAYQEYRAVEAKWSRPRGPKRKGVSVKEIVEAGSRWGRERMAALDAAWGPVDAFLRTVPVPTLGDFSWDWYGETEEAHGPEWPDPWPWPGRPRGLVAVGAPLDLFDLIRLELAADFAASREVRTCKLEECGRLFIWHRGKGPVPQRSRGLPPGPKPNYCSYLHARKAAPRGAGKE